MLSEALHFQSALSVSQLGSGPKLRYRMRTLQMKSFWKIGTVVVFALLAATRSCSDSRFFVPLKIRTVVVFVLLAATGSCSDSRFFSP